MTTFYLIHTIMKHFKSSEFCTIYKLDDDDRKRMNTDARYFAGNGHFCISGDSCRWLEKEFERIAQKLSCKWEY